MKLIRSKCNDFIESHKILLDDDIKQRKLFLMKKLDEEVHELKESKFKDINEYGDVLEVIEALVEINELILEDIYKAKDIKKEKFGDFSRGIYLKKDN